MIESRIADKWIAENRYTNLREVGHELCAAPPSLMTTALVLGLGLSEAGYRRRYCYEHAEQARIALSISDSNGHPPGPWIKCKGDCGDLLYPAWTV